MRRSAGDRLLPVAVSALLQNVQEQLAQSHSEEITSRLVRLLHCISPRVTDGETPAILDVDLNVVRALCAEGVPDQCRALRAALWKLLLGYLPTNLFKWDQSLAASRKAHAVFVQELLDDLHAMPASQSSEMGEPGASALIGVLDQIKKDIYRTKPELDFFTERIGGHTSDDQLHSDPSFGEMSLDVSQPRCHYDALARVLLLYGKLNPLIQYVQGMNDLCAPLYYLFAQDPLISDAAEAEADTFFCFSLVMSNLHEAFIKSFDYEEHGLMGRIDQYSNLLHKKDAEVWRHLEAQNVQPVFYAVSWLTLMLSHEFEMQEILRLWDSLLGDLAWPHPLLQYLCIAKVVLVRDVLLAGDFADCLRTLQHYPPFSAEDLLQCARQLRTTDLAPEGFSNQDLSGRRS